MKVYKKKQIIERITVIDDTEKKSRWLDEFFEEGYRLVHIGGKHMSKYRRSLTRIKIVAEKEIK